MSQEISQGKGNYDLSEAHLAYFFGNRSNDPLGNTPNDKNIVYDQYAWHGQSNLAAVFLTTWSGLTTEDDVPLPSGLKYSGNSAEKIPPEKEYHACAYIKESVFSDYSMSRMKELIMQFQAVEFGLKLDTNYYNSDTAAACNPDKVNANHSVVAIGWDDNYSAKKMVIRFFGKQKVVHGKKLKKSIKEQQISGLMKQRKKVSHIIIRYAHL